MNKSILFECKSNVIFNYYPLKFYYVVQVNAPWFHSWYNPIKRIIIKNILVKDQTSKFENLIIIIIGKIKAISTSKIKKIIAIIKNRKEKGNREDSDGSNPHSKGDLFSRSIKAFLDKIEANTITIVAIINTIVAMIVVEKITYTKLCLVLMIGSHIYFYTI